MNVVKHKVKIFLKKVILAVLRHPGIKEKLLPFVRRFPGLYVRLKRIQYLGEISTGKDIVLTKTEKDIVLSEEGGTVYRDLKIILKSSTKKRAGSEL